MPQNWFAIPLALAFFTSSAPALAADPPPDESPPAETEPPPDVVEPPEPPPPTPLPAPATEVVQPTVAPPEAPPPDWLSRVELSGVLFLNYRFELTDGQDNLNSFDVTRSYLTAIVKPRAHVRAKLTFDAPGRETVIKGSGATTEVAPGAGKLYAVLKHAFVELYDVGTPGFSIKFGQHDLPWVPFIEKQWTYRFQGPVLADREGYLSSTDLGLGAGYVAPSKRFEVHASVVNGETWGKPEVSRHKDVHWRWTARPLPSLPGLGVHVFYGEGRYAAGDDQVRRRLIPELAFEHKWGTIGVEYLRAWDPPGAMKGRQPSLSRSTETVAKAQGLSAFGWLDLRMVNAPPGVRVVGRIDWLDPDVDLDDNAHTRVIVGVGYQANKYLNTLLDFEAVSYQDGAAADASMTPKTELRTFLHSAIGF